MMFRFSKLPTLHKVPRQFLTCVKVLTRGRNRDSESSLGSASDRLLILVTPPGLTYHLKEGVNETRCKLSTAKLGGNLQSLA
jgi:hypothetical protein